VAHKADADRRGAGKSTGGAGSRCTAILWVFGRACQYAPPQSTCPAVCELMSSMIQGARGRLDLQFCAPAPHAATILHVQAQEPPLRVVRAFSAADGSAFVHLHNLSGGVLGGDELTLRAEIGPQARVQLTSTGATRVYRQRTAQPEAVQTNDLRIHAGGLLEYLPDVLIPYAQARYRQTTRINLGSDAGLFYWEIVTPGREARGEIFAYERVQLDLDIHATGRPIALERVVLEPQLRPLTSSVRLNHYRYYGSFYACRVGVAASQWSMLEAQLDDLGRSLSVAGESIWGVSTLPAHGLVIRGAALTSRCLLQGVLRCWQVAKRELYGTEALLPRKIY
jgi:urease accessory protein